MAEKVLKKGKDGAYVVKNEKQFDAAVTLYAELIEALREELRECEGLWSAATAYMVKSGKKEITTESGRVYKLVERMTRKWIGTKDDLKGLEAVDGAMSLREIVGKKKVVYKGKKVLLWNVLTRRIPDAEKIEEAISEGLVDEDAVMKAFVEIPQKPYIQK